MAFTRRKQVIAAVAFVLLLAVIVPPMITVGMFKKQIQSSMSAALGRPVTIGNTSARVFPQPGFDLENVVIGDDPAFGAEAIIRADEVSTNLRLTSLWRGRLEIAKLTLRYPSMNLVRAANGRWNIEALLERASQSGAAPTSKSHPEARSRFPYIESDKGRINFKFDNEKAVFSLFDADFALWQESENEWGVRMKARPVRTDLNLSDTGDVRLSARFQRARTVAETPLQVQLGWQQAQLGQLTSLIYGRDRGWRGSVEANAVLSGTPQSLQVTADARVDDFRRYDIFTTEAFRIQAHCTGHYSTATDILRQVQCALPTDANGAVTLRGEVRGPTRLSAYDLSMTAASVPMQVLVAFARHAKRDVPDDLRATGQIEATFSGRKQEPNSAAEWQGGGSTAGVILQSKLLEGDLSLGNVQFALVPGRAQQHNHRSRARRTTAAAAPAERRLTLLPFSVPLGGQSSANAAAWFSTTGYEMTAKGEADVPRLLQVARVLGISTADLNAEGKAVVDVAVSGAWTGLAAPRPTGIVQLRGLRTELKGVNTALQIAGADVFLDPEQVRLENLNASFAGVPVNVVGSLRMPRRCASVEECPVTFDLRADQLSTSAVNRLINPNQAKRPWYRILALPSGGKSVLSRVRAQGHLGASRFVAGTVTATRLSANARLDSGVLALTNAQAELLGGHHVGEYRMDFTGEVPAYSVKAKITNLNVAQLSAATKDHWGTGMANVSYSGTMRGLNRAELAATADVAIDFDLRRGELRSVLLPSGAPLRFTNFSGHASLQRGVLTFQPSKAATQRGILEISGTASFARQLALRLQDGAKAFTISGTLENPKVEAIPTEVSLKQ